jgi:hypothetical protein
VQKKITLVSGRIIASSSEELAAHLAAEASKWKSVIEAAGIRESQ